MLSGRIARYEFGRDPGLAARPGARPAQGSRPARRIDPVMLGVTLWRYAYLRGVLSTRAVEDRCLYDATFRSRASWADPVSTHVLPVLSPVPHAAWRE